MFALDGRRTKNPMPRRPATPSDAPPLAAGRWSVLTLVLGQVVGLAGGVACGVIGEGGIDWVAAAFTAGAGGCLMWLIGDAIVDRLRAGGGRRSLSDARPPEWAADARTESRQHAERAAAIADGVGDPYLSTQRYVAEYFRRANAWVGETNRRLQGRFSLVAAVAVCGVLAAVCGMTPQRAKEQSFVALGWPAVVAAVAATFAGMEVLARGRRWERVFAAWREWATDSETPDLPPPTPAVELVKPPAAKKAPVPPPPPSVVELVAPPPPPKPVPSPPPPPKPVPPPPPKPVPPPPSVNPPQPLPGEMERLKNLNLNPPPNDDYDTK